jgi:hypothetical protein
MSPLDDCRCSTEMRPAVDKSSLEERFHKCAHDQTGPRRTNRAGQRKARWCTTTPAPVALFRAHDEKARLGTEGLDVATVSYRTNDAHDCFHWDTDTLETRSNVAGTGKAATKVIVAIGRPPKGCSVK